MKLMKKKLFFVFFSLLGFFESKAQAPRSIYDSLYDGFTQSFSDICDLALPDWGPYSQNYNGISHLSNHEKGLAFELSIHPAYHTRQRAYPATVKYENNCHLWEASPDLSYFSSRYELEWKDQVYCDVSFSKMEKNVHLLRIDCTNKTDLTQDIVLNLFANITYPSANFSDTTIIDSSRFISNKTVPKITYDIDSNLLFLKYPDVERHYAIYWEYEYVFFRHFFTDKLDRLLYESPNNFSSKKNQNKDKNQPFWANLFFQPIIIEPQSNRVISVLLFYGDKERIKETLQKYKTQNNLDNYYRNARKGLLFPIYNSIGKDYAFCQQLMQATLSANVAYPVQCSQNYVKRNTPVAIWDPTYRWHAGFMGLGFADINHGRAVECLNSCTMPCDSQIVFESNEVLSYAQFYLFWELWNKTQNHELLAYFYPKLKQYYRFLTKNQFQSKMIKPKNDFFYSTNLNDYPPKTFIYQNNLQEITAPVIITAHVIRIAKIMRMAAFELNKNVDAEFYKTDIQLFSEALQEHSWDSKSAYFGYVLHDSIGYPVDILQTVGEENFNKGINGCLPLIAGVCSKSQEEKIIEHLFSEGQLWTKQGLSMVDQTASYYSENGYCNGSVRIAPQWFFFKTMLDLNYPDKARQIAKTALNIWKQEVEATYNCFEFISIASGRGVGEHQFSGLTSPIIDWYNTFYQPGKFTTGFNIWIKNRTINTVFTQFQADLVIFDGKRGGATSVFLCMNENERYTVFWNGKNIGYYDVHNGLLQIEIPLSGKVTTGILEVKPF